MDANKQIIADIVKRAAAQGVLLREEAGELRFKLKVKQFPGDIKQEIVQHKAAIVQFLSRLSANIDKPSSSQQASAVRALTPTIPVQPRPIANAVDAASKASTQGSWVFPTSYAQQRLVLIDNLQGSTPEYNTPRAYQVDGELDIPLLTRVFEALIERHEIIRTQYQEHVEASGEQAGHVAIQQRVLPMSAVDFQISVIDMSHEGISNHSSQAEQKQSVSDYINRSFATPFDLANDVMLRVEYLKTSQAQGMLLLNMHHIATDGWSMEVLTKELFTLYRAFAQQQANPLPALPIQYGDFAHWQRRDEQQHTLEKQLQYWAEQLDDLPTLHHLTLDKPRPPVKQHQGDVVTGSLPQPVAGQLARLANQFGITPFMLYHGVFSLMLSRYSNSHDIVVGTPVANRMLPELEPLIGFFVNTLVLRVNTQQSSTAAYFEHIKQVHVQAQANQDVPFEHLVDQLKPARSQAHNPLFQIMMTTNTQYGLGRSYKKGDEHNNQGRALDLAGVSIQPYRPETVQSKFDLHLSVNFTQSHGLPSAQFEWTYDTSLFERASITRFNQHFVRLLTVLSESPELTVNQWNMLSETETQRLVFDVNNTAHAFPDDTCIHRFFEQQVQTQPDAIALVVDEAQLTYQECTLQDHSHQECTLQDHSHQERTHQERNYQTLTYQALNEHANQLAHYLQQVHDVMPGTLVGLCTERSLSMVVGMLAILKAGAAYVPLDPHLPSDRLHYMLTDADLSVVLSHAPAKSALLAACAETTKSALFLDDAEVAQTLARYPSHDLHAAPVEDTPKPENQADSHRLMHSEKPAHSPRVVQPEDVAYVIYTSGSTGKPKGVPVSHRALVNRIHWMHEQYGMSPHDKVLQKTPYSFDVSVWEFVWTLGFGGQLVMAKPGGHADPEYLCELIQQAGITKLHFVPSMLGSILETPAFAQCDSIKQIFCSGEALQQSHVQGCKAALPHAHLHNLYGPTEAAIDVSYWDCSGDISQGVPIGKPIHNIQLLILDEALNLVPEGAVGELHIGGVGLAQGYLNREALTQARFIANPYFDASRANSSPRLYKTGDLARLRPDGNIEYQGRTDHQVKIRGFRIELGEIEHQLSALENVDSALVMAQSLAGSQQLIGYVKVNDAKLLAEDAKEAFISDCKQQLRVVLPEYMVPSVLIALAAWPTTSNGKIDRKALPVLDSQLLHAHFVAPQTDTERELVRLWSTLLSLDEADISTQANFFELGGHSLLANTMLAKMRGSFGVNIKLDKVFTEPTIMALAKIIDDLVVINQLKKVEQEQEFLSGGVL